MYQRKLIISLDYARHGQTNSNAHIKNGQPLAINDEPLNQIGIQQANELAEQLKEVKFDSIISSPIKRAFQTAEIVNQYHDLTISSDAAWQEIQTNGYVDMDTWNDLFNFDKNIPVEGSESLEEFFERVYAAIDNLKNKYKDKTVLIVSHGGIQHALYAYVNKVPLSGNMRISPMKNCEYRIYEIN